MFTALKLLDPLAAPHGVDRYLELVRPRWSLREARAEIVAVRHPTPGSVTLALRPNGAWRGFAAGQFVPVTVEIDGVKRTRTYSPASSALARDARLELTIRAHEQGVVSRHLKERAHPGMVLGLGAADGDFVLPAGAEPLTLISGGSGVTPVMSMLRTLVDSDDRRPVTFLHYAPRATDVVYRDELAALARRRANVRVLLAHTREPSGDLSGHLCVQHVAALAPGGPAYVCGPPALLDAVRELWPGPVHSESFVPASPIVPTGDASGSVRFVASGREAANSGQVLLEQAEAAGLTPEHGCRMGICHSCTCRKVAGTVRNVLTGELSSAEDEPIQICVSVPAGDVALDL
jgi:stearoyl-CoA 9-desaturase NADPH oxidoreductase